MNDRQFEQILKLAGGKGNIRQVKRDEQSTILMLEDHSKVDMSAPDAVDLETIIRITGAECFLVIKDETSSYYRLLRDMGKPESIQDHPERKERHTYRKSFSLLEFISDVFRPIMPAILGAAVFKIVLAVITLISTYGFRNPHRFYRVRHL